MIAYLVLGVCMVLGALTLAVLLRYDDPNADTDDEGNGFS